jgi:hypothetical protein
VNEEFIKSWKEVSKHENIKESKKKERKVTQAAKKAAQDAIRAT